MPRTGEARGTLAVVTPSHEPRIARVAALVADPARSRMLCRLLSGERATAGELARAASVSASTASEHLARLLEAGLVVVETRGRHRWYQLADAHVAHALEALALVAERGSREREWSHPARRGLREARCCYGHLAGELGVRVLRTMLARGDLRTDEGGDAGYELTAPGRERLAALGMAVPAPTRRRYAYACLDWSERSDHLAGLLADEMLAHFIDQGWLRRTEGRALALTPTGTQRLLPWLAGEPVRSRCG